MKFRSRNPFFIKKTISRVARLQQNPPQRWRWDEAPSPPKAGGSRLTFPTNPSAPPSSPKPARPSTTSAHAQRDVTCAPRALRSWQEGPCQLPPPRRFGGRTAGSRCFCRRRGAAGVARPSEGRAAARPWDCAEPGDSRDPSGPGPERVSSGGPRPPARGAGAPAAVAGAAAGGGGGGQDHVGPPLRWRGRGLRGRGGRGRGTGRPGAVRGVPQRGRGASQEAGDTREGEQPRHGGEEVHPAPLRRR